MHEDYGYEQDDEGYDDDQYNYDNMKHFFKFDPKIINNWTDFWKKWNNTDGIFDQNESLFIMGWHPWTNNPNFVSVPFPVSSSVPNAGGSNFQYLGSNYYGQEVWKPKYFVCDKLAIEYINHLRVHAVNFLKQPTHYRALFNIMN